MHFWTAISVGALLSVTACSGDDATTLDAGRDATADAEEDASLPDSGVMDGSERDGAPPDAAVRDATTPDGGVCVDYAAAAVLGNVESGALDEISGLMASRMNADVLWVHNDSGDSARVFALSRDGRHLGEYALEGARHRDWEDMTLGPGPDPGRDYLYVGDHGDNAARDTGVGRDAITIYRVAEPMVDADQTPVTESLDAVDAFTLVYPAGPHDCEALVVDPDTQDLYLLTKENDGLSELYVARAPLSDAMDNTLSMVGTLTFGPGETPGGPFATGADLSSDGRRLLVRTYSRVLLFTRGPGANIEDALMAGHTTLTSASEMQGEAIAWAADGRGYYTISEGSGRPVNFFAEDPSCAP